MTQITPLYEEIYKDNFSFWKNWQDFLTKLDDAKIETAKQYLIAFLNGEENIRGKTIIDFGSGSGLMSLCFALLGARVTSVDIDDSSIACTELLRKKYNISSENWMIQKWSVLDKEFIAMLGSYDIVYSWGVIHHSGNMWKWLEHIIALTHEDSQLYVAIYNNNTIMLEWTSPFWVRAKKLYSSSRILRPFIKSIYTLYLILGLIAYGKNPITYIRDYRKNALRGMDFFVDIEDWLWGYPYEYATYHEIQDFYEKRGFLLKKWVRVRSIGCNEFLFSRVA